LVGGEELRWAWNLLRFTQLRARLPPERFYDMGYRELLHDPIPEVGRVFARLGEGVTAEARTSVAQWLENNRRDKRPAHEYSLSEFRLSEEGLRHDFAEYRATFLGATEQ
jgi:hypothetical protein